MPNWSELPQEGISRPAAPPLWLGKKPKGATKGVGTLPTFMSAGPTMILSSGITIILATWKR